MSKELKTRPSKLYAVGKDLQGHFWIGDRIAAYNFDSAVMCFGMALQNELDSVEGKDAKEIQEGRTRIFHRWIPKASVAEPIAKPAHKFADPAKRL